MHYEDLKIESEYLALHDVDIASKLKTIQNKTGVKYDLLVGDSFSVYHTVNGYLGIYVATQYDVDKWKRINPDRYPFKPTDHYLEVMMVENSRKR